MKKEQADRIVEAVMTKILGDTATKETPQLMHISIPYFRAVLETVELEGVCKDCNGSGQVPFGEEQGQILYTDCPCIKDHPSKRDLLIDFAKWIYNESNSYYHIQNPLIDRYLKEKGGEG